MTQPKSNNRRSHDRRRRVDAAIVLPLVGAVLVFVPVLWPSADSATPVNTSSASIYLFLVWAAMIFGAVILAYILRPSTSAEPSDD